MAEGGKDEGGGVEHQDQGYQRGQHIAPQQHPGDAEREERIKVVLETLGKAHNERLLAALRDAVAEVYIETDDHYTRFDT